MDKETIKNIINFLEKNDNKNKPFKWKLLNNEPLTEDELTIKGNLNLSDLEIETLPKGLKVGGDLFLIGCKNLTSLPKGLQVGGFLALTDCSNLTSLPEGLEVEGWLDLENTSITSLPKGLKVGGFLDFRGTQLQEYTDKQLREMIKPGFVKGLILR